MLQTYVIFWCAATRAAFALWHGQPGASQFEVVLVPETESDTLMNWGAEKIRSVEKNTFDLTDIAQFHSPDGRCLNFLHIPKNAGTSMEAFSVTAHTAEGYSPKWGEKDSQLQCSHPGNCRKVPWPCQRGCDISTASGQQGICSIWHTPPALDSTLANYYQQCNTFCIVRNPLHRSLSEFLWEGGACNLEHYEMAMQKTFEHDLPNNQFYKDCHFLPQVQYIYGQSQPTQHPHCQHVLHMENLTAEFHDLMGQYNINSTMIPRTNTRSCEFDWAKVSEKTRGLIEEYYTDDYDAFGFTKST